MGEGERITSLFNKRMIYDRVVGEPHHRMNITCNAIRLAAHPPRVFQKKKKKFSAPLISSVPVFDVIICGPLICDILRAII